MKRAISIGLIIRCKILLQSSITSMFQKTCHISKYLKLLFHGFLMMGTTCVFNASRSLGTFMISQPSLTRSSLKCLQIFPITSFSEALQSLLTVQVKVSNMDSKFSKISDSLMSRNLSPTFVQMFAILESCCSLILCVALLKRFNWTSDSTFYHFQRLLNQTLICWNWVSDCLLCSRHCQK